MRDGRTGRTFRQRLGGAGDGDERAASLHRSGQEGRRSPPDGERQLRHRQIGSNDVDVVFLPGPGYPRHSPKLDSDELVWPFLQLIVAADDADFETWATRQFSTDRKNRPKGVVEVIL
jgi:hypothetical protein